MKIKTKTQTKKNYLILGVIYVVVIILVLYLASWYTTYKNYQQEIPVLKDTLLEVKTDELGHYLQENPDAILYLCTASDSECREFETSIKKALQNNDYPDLVYINLEDIDDTITYLEDLLKDYGGSDYTITRVPCLIKFTDGKITDAEDGLNGALLTKDEALNFLDVNEIE